MSDHPYTNMTTWRNFEAQQPCPSCGDPMDGVGWRCACDDGITCKDASCWMGAWGDCRACTTEEVAEAVRERIADELLRLSDSYINHWKAADAMEFGDIWTWTAELARMIRAGELTHPLPQEPPF